MLLLSFLFLQAAAPQNNMVSFMFILAMFLVFWLFIIRPQNKRQKEQKTFMETLQKGAEIVTSSGILGRITKMEDNIITIEVGAKVYLRITRSSISKELTESIYGAGKKTTPTIEAE
ncbi:MAG: preprotein translocase subunit YajC [Haliscomenobacter sp.]|nr:preprotein translocase subunit YajC [Haliscomenobacter sp.]MBP9077638.1 preprotein translocase subunit YajC [Haliscomenobacter sp.]MBP9874128.1 preprotein translocase subunit YajC [Haliscomenobacter sp.]